MNDLHVVSAQVLYLLNSWASVELGRKDGKISIEEQVAEFSSKMFTIAMAWGLLVEDKERLNILNPTMNALFPELDAAADVLYPEFLENLLAEKESH